MFKNPRIIWLNDRLSQTFVVVVIAAAIATYFIVTRGWAW